MKIFKSLLLTYAVLSSGMLSAAEFQWLTFKLSDSTELSVAAKDLSMNYSDGNLQITSGQVNQTLPVNTIKSMRFTTEATGIESIIPAANQTASYFNMDGINVGTFKSIDDAQKVLPSGCYIGVNESGTFKVIF